jgi:transcriptional antiterminator Rof (Rho-off)
MTDEEVRRIHQKIAEGGKVDVAEAIERHRRLGESIAIEQDGKVVILEADQIPPMTNGDRFTNA